MLKRIKNLLDISRYTVEEVVNPVAKKPTETDTEYYERTWGYTSSTPDNPVRLAKIVELKEPDVFKELLNDTPEQPLDDRASRNG